MTTAIGLLSFALTAITGSALAWTALGPRVSLMASFFCVYFYVFFGLAAGIQLRDGDFPLASTVRTEDAERALEVTIAFVAAAGVGYAVTRGRGSIISPPRRVLAVRRVRPVALLAVLVAGGEVARTGGPRTLFSDRTTRGLAFGIETNTALAGIHAALATLPVFVVAYCAIQQRRLLGGRDTIFCVGLFAIALALTNPVSSSRYLFGTVAVGLLIAILTPLTTRAFRLLVVGSLAIILFSFQVLNKFRYAHSESAATGISFDLRTQLTQGDYDSFQQVVNGVHLVLRSGIEPKQLLGPPFFWLPRDWWAGKPMDTGVVIAQSVGFDFTNLSAPLPAELYLSAGFLGVVVGGLAVGLFWARLDQTIQAGYHLSYMGLLTPILAIYQVILLRGSLLTVTANIVVIAGILLLLTTRVGGEVGRTGKPMHRLPQLGRLGSAVPDLRALE